MANYLIGSKALSPTGPFSSVNKVICLAFYASLVISWLTQVLQNKKVIQSLLAPGFSSEKKEEYPGSSSASPGHSRTGPLQEAEDPCKKVRTPALEGSVDPTECLHLLCRLS